MNDGGDHSEKERKEKCFKLSQKLLCYCTIKAQSDSLYHLRPCRCMDTNGCNGGSLAAELIAGPDWLTESKSTFAGLVCVSLLRLCVFVSGDLSPTMIGAIIRRVPFDYCDQ